MNKQQEINDYLDELKERIRKTQDKSIGIPDQLVYFVDLLQDGINKIYENNNDFIIRW